MKKLVLAKDRIQKFIINFNSFNHIFPGISVAIDNVFNRLKIKNSFSFFVTANHLEVQATCSAMPLGDTAEIILTSKLIEVIKHRRT